MDTQDVLIGLVTGHYAKDHWYKYRMPSLSKAEKSSLSTACVNTQFLNIISSFVTQSCWKPPKPAKFWDPSCNNRFKGPLIKSNCDQLPSSLFLLPSTLNFSPSTSPQATPCTQRNTSFFRAESRGWMSPLCQTMWREVKQFSLLPGCVWGHQVVVILFHIEATSPSVHTLKLPSTTFLHPLTLSSLGQPHAMTRGDQCTCHWVRSLFKRVQFLFLITSKPKGTDSNNCFR
jgi:hypothetical protein